MSERELRERLAKTARILHRKGLTPGASGNISARHPGSGTCLIKPSGVSFNELEPESFITVDIETMKVLHRDAKPSIETPFHTRLYQERPEACAVVHVHPRYSTILATVGVEIVPMGIEIFSAPALAKGIPVSRFASPGTDELAENMVEAMKDHVACLMPHHGATAIGKTVEEAALNVEVMESLAQLHYDVMQVAEPRPLPEALLRKLVDVTQEKGLHV